MSIVDERMSTHGDPVANMKEIAEAWGDILGTQLRAATVADMMAVLHVIRNRNAPLKDPAHLRHRDGYLEIAEKCRAQDALERRLP